MDAEKVYAKETRLSFIQRQVDVIFIPGFHLPASHRSDELPTRKFRKQESPGSTERCESWRISQTSLFAETGFSQADGVDGIYSRRELSVERRIDAHFDSGSFGIGDDVRGFCDYRDGTANFADS
jgi:hypothetical protein